jgi:hypothetical protein
LWLLRESNPEPYAYCENSDGKFSISWFHRRDPLVFAGLFRNHEIGRLVGMCALVGAIGCAAEVEDDVRLRLTSPCYTTVRAGVGTEAFAIVSVADDGSYARVAIASDRGGDTPGREAPVRLSLVALVGGVRKLPDEAVLMFRDRETGVDCNDWVGLVIWQDGGIQLNAYCATAPTVRLIGGLDGAWVRIASGN